ncbi:adenosine deaminase-related growth [Ramaria rubella]|nr:adenosine deaminase-related growth [Ramaria rubella]
MALDAYMTSRAELLATERSLRRDFAYKANISASEERAEAIIRRLRLEEANTIWGDKHEDIPHPFPGMEFLTARKIIEKTQLFKILRKMPKGGLLHVHLDATVDTSILLRIALEQPSIHVRAGAPLVTGNFTQSLPEFRALPPEEYGKSADLASSSYLPDTWVPLKEARQAFSLGTVVFDQWVLGALTINPTEAYKTHNTVTKIWEKFTSTFLVSQGLIRFSPIWEQYIREFLLSSIADGIMYVEARINFLYRFMIGPDGKENIPHDQWLEIFDRVITSVRKELNSQQRGDEFVGAKIIYTTIRFISPKELEWYINDCIQLKQKFPHLIAGFDLVGDENVLRPLTYYLEPLLRFKEKQKELGIDIPFLFHAGETLGDGNHVDENLFDAILLGTKRIGHGFSLVKHPTLMQMCKERGIALEVCPISNEILRLTSSMPMHPLPILLNYGVPVALSSDDPAIFGNLDLSYDFYQVLVSSEITGLATLAVAARDSIEFSTLSGPEKARFLALWEKRYAAFVDDVCSEYA